MKKRNLWILALCILVITTTSIFTAVASAAVTPTIHPILYLLTVDFSGNGGKATVDVTPPGESIKVKKVFYYQPGTVVTLKANDYMVQPETTGYMFTSWSGDATGSARTITITMDGNKSVTAHYAAIAIDWWTPTPTRRITPTGRVTPTPTPVSGAYVVIYTIQSDWGTGATVNVTIKNDTTVAVNGWTLNWSFPGNQTITNLWNGSFTQSGAAVAVKDAGFNAYIPANGGTVNFGFNLNYSGTNSEPTSFFLNGMICQTQ